MNILDINDPKFLKTLSIEELNQLAHDIREFLLETVSKTGGHLSSNLGIVEITIALHFVFDAPKDKILFDVGHQSYVHKILTGRAAKMHTLRQFNGLAGFQKRYESEYDCFEAGHSGTSLSTSLGMAIARDLNSENYNVVPVIGDAAIMSGPSLEALNQIGYEQKKLIIVFNDNNMSINKNVGALSKNFAKLRNARTYNSIKDEIKDFLKDKKYGNLIYNGIHNFKKLIKNQVIDSGIFKEFNIEYIGPIDGHDISSLIRAFEVAKTKNIPCVVHCVTKKGKGYKYTEADTTGLWHGVPKFDIKTGKFLNECPKDYKSYSKIVADAVEMNMSKNKDIVCITPAMITGSKLNNVFAKYPNRCFDCGIAEDHTLSFAAGLALNGKFPFVSIYSSFMQRAYDQLNQDISRARLPIVVGVDRAGLVGDDGETHHGVFDIALLRTLPYAIICQGKNSIEIENLIYTGFNQNDPFFIRYPRGQIKYFTNSKVKLIDIGSWELFENTSKEKCTIITYGNYVELIQDLIIKDKLPYNLINARFIKPIDKKILLKVARKKKPIFVYTNEILKGGLGDEILEFLNQNNISVPVYIMGIDDVFATHGSNIQLIESLNLDIKTLLKNIEKVINA